MLENKDIVSIQSSLMAGNYHQFLSDLRRLGRPIKEAWLKSSLVNAIDDKYKFTSNGVFKDFLLKNINANMLESANAAIDDVSQYVSHLKNQLSLLALFITAWKDDPAFPEPPEIEQLGLLQEAQKKKLRQQIKFKAFVDKNDRHAINIGLLTMAFMLCQQSNDFIRCQEKTSKIYALDHAMTNEELNQFKDIQSKQALLCFISKHIKSLNNFKSDRYPEAIEAVNDEFDLIDKKQTIEKIGRAISSFQTPNKKKKLVKYGSILLAFISSLACGLSTGGAIFLVFPSLPILGFILGGLICLFGFSANFGFFSKNFSDFLLSLLKKGGISEYIDSNGTRRQLSKLKKYLLIPLAALASLTVGIGAMGITYTTVLALAAKLLPILALIWPPLPLIIVGILSAAIGITLTVAVLVATIEAIKNSDHFTWANVKAKIDGLSKLQILVYALKGLVVGVGLFGLAYYRYTAGLDLAMFIGPIAAGIMGVFAYVPQAFFTVFSINKLIRFFSPPHTPQEAMNSQPKSGFSRVKSIVNSIYEPVCLIGNALGNAALVVVDSLSALSVSGAIGCFVNSWAGNMPEKNKNLQQKRNLATDALVKELEGFNLGTLGDAPPVCALNQPVENNKHQSRPNLAYFYPQELIRPANPVPSPTHSDEGLVACTVSRSGSFTSQKKGTGNIDFMRFFKRVFSNEPKVEPNHKSSASPIMH